MAFLLPARGEKGRLLAPDLAAWFVLRLFTGVGLAFPWLVGETWINAIVKHDMRA